MNDTKGEVVGFLIREISNAKRKNYATSMDVFDCLYSSNHKNNQIGYHFRNGLNEKNIDTCDILYKDRLVLSLNSNFREIIESIEKSLYILDLEDNFDAQGASKYTFQNFKDSIKYFINLVNTINDKHTILVKKPNIYHAPENTIDIDWNYESFQCLLNLNVHNNTYSYYGKTVDEKMVIRCDETPIVQLTQDKNLIGFLKNV